MPATTRKRVRRPTAAPRPRAESSPSRGSPESEHEDHQADQGQGPKEKYDTPYNHRRPDEVGVDIDGCVDLGIDQPLCVDLPLTRWRRGRDQRIEFRRVGHDPGRLRLDIFQVHPIAEIRQRGLRRGYRLRRDHDEWLDRLGLRRGCRRGGRGCDRPVEAVEITIPPGHGRGTTGRSDRHARPYLAARGQDRGRGHDGGTGTVRPADWPHADVATMRDAERSSASHFIEKASCKRTNIQPGR